MRDNGTGQQNGITGSILFITKLLYCFSAGILNRKPGASVGTVCSFGVFKGGHAMT